MYALLYISKLQLSSFTDNKNGAELIRAIFAFALFLPVDRQKTAFFHRQPIAP